MYGSDDMMKTLIDKYQINRRRKNDNDDDYCKIDEEHETKRRWRYEQRVQNERGRKKNEYMKNNREKKRIYYSNMNY